HDVHAHARGGAGARGLPGGVRARARIEHDAGRGVRRPDPEELLPADPRHPRVPRLCGAVRGLRHGPALPRPGARAEEPLPAPALLHPSQPRAVRLDRGAQRGGGLRLPHPRHRDRDALERMRQEAAVSEAMILSTCNRVELYARSDETTGSGTRLEEFLCAFHGRPLPEIAPYLYRLTGADAVRHAFRVAASLESMVI